MEERRRDGVGSVAVTVRLRYTIHGHSSKDNGPGGAEGPHSLTTTLRPERQSAALPKTTEGRPNKHFTHASIYPLKDRRDTERRGECPPASSTRRPRQGILQTSAEGKVEK